MNDTLSGQINLWLGNSLSIGAIVTSFMGVVPGIAAAVALIWYLIQIFESATAQRWLATRRNRKLARLKARVLMMEAQQQPPLPGPFDDVLDR